ncbi:MAG: sodium/proline symporter [Bacteroidetes bacterium]|nr:sodium/proline symporter [Bacteroidota bacterium]
MITVFVLYLVVVMGLAIWSAMRSKTNSDFILGGRKISGVSLALSERATGESAWLLLGLTGEAYALGFQSIWVAIGCVAGILFIWIVMSGPLRRETERTGALTIPSLISRKFPGTEKPIGILSGIIVIFFFLFYIAAQFKGAGDVFERTFGLSPLWGMIIGSLVVVVYTSFGGFMAVVATDVFQAILMIFTLIALPVILLLVMASYNVDFARNLHAAGEGYASLTGGLSGSTAALAVVNGLCWAFGYTGQPQLLSRMMALKNEKDVKRAIWVAVCWTLIAYVGAILIGITGKVMITSAQIPGLPSQLKDAEQILPMLTVTLINPILAGVLLSGVVSAMMSTASSELIICSSSMSEDIYGNVVKKRMTDKRMISFNQILTLSVGVFAFLVILVIPDTIFRLVSYSWAGIGSSFGPALLLLLFWKRFSRAGVFASLIFGSLSAVAWKEWILPRTHISEILGSFIISFIMAVLFSLIFPEKKNGSY